MKYVRIACGLAVLGASLAVTSWLIRDSEAKRLRDRLEQLEQERRVLTEVVDRLSREERVAEVIVVGQERDPDNHIASTRIQFIELDRDGHPLVPREFCLPGRVVYFDGLVIKFDEKYVAAGDPLRGKSIMLFRRVFSELISPRDGPLIDGDGEIPDVFRVNANPSEFEKKLWRQFWSYVSDPQLAKQDGIRVAQGEAVYAPMAAGQRWTLTLESDGGLNLRLIAPASAPAAG